jgi:hypothetical protein
MSQQFRRQFVALREMVTDSLRGVPQDSLTSRATQLLHRLMFLTFLQRNGRLDGGPHSFPALLRRLPFAEATAELPDATLARVLAVFDRFDWQLYEAPGDGPVAPNALADTFEQSVNRRQTGTYYTRRDVTRYIIVGTILPHLVQVAAAACPDVLGPEGWGWRLLRDDPDRYLFPALSNAEARAALCDGAIRTADDLVTWNVNAWIFLLGLVSHRDSGRLPRMLHEALQRLTVLDPTCGCGDFLLIALHLLVNLRVACLNRLHRRAEPELAIEAILRHNLRGVDLMPEAVEVCKMRLWLQWAVEASGPFDLGQLPDLSGTIRAGDAVARSDGQAPFSEVTRQGGFAVVVGNPPYIETATAEPQQPGYRTAGCGNLYALVVERALGLLAPDGRLGMIVPHSAFCTDRMAPLLQLVTEGAVTWVSTYDIRPCKLFAGVDQRLAIFLRHASPRPRTFSTRYHRWQKAERPQLFERLRYVDVGGMAYENSIPKAGDPLEQGIWHKIHAKALLRDGLGGEGVVYYHNAPRYWVRAMTFAPYFWNERDGAKLSQQVRTLPVRRADPGAVAAILNSSLFCWWWLLLSDCRHLNRREIDRFPAGIAEMSADCKRALRALCRRLMADYRRHAVRKVCCYRTTGKVVYDEFYPGRSKAILDEIDDALAGHYGLTDDELYFLIHHDIKYRRPED